jgi:hypothetical protein
MNGANDSVVRGSIPRSLKVKSKNSSLKEELGPETPMHITKGRHDSLLSNK